jgi:ribosomal protein S18 acetylase RimI-like enzyme
MDFEIMPVHIKPITIEMAVIISRMIPEFANPHPGEEYERRLRGKSSLILAAYIQDKPAGFKVGYDKFGDGSFYSWMGGVVPEFRRHHVAKALAEEQEKWAFERGFTSIVFKTRNRHKAMLSFAIGNGFSIIEVEPRESLDEYRIILKKELQKH